MLDSWRALPLNDGASTSTAHLTRKSAVTKRGKKADANDEPVESDAISEESSSESLATLDDDNGEEEEEEEEDNDDDIEESEEAEEADEPAKPVAKAPARGRPAARGKAAAKAAPPNKRAPARSKATSNSSVAVEKTTPIASKKLNPVSISSPSGMPQRRVGLSKRIKARPLSPVRIPSANASK